MAKSIYSVHPSVQMVQSVIAGMKDKTGRTMEEWVKFIKKEGPKDVAARRDWLKDKHKLGTNYAWWLADWSVGKQDEDGDPDKYLAAAVKYVETMYSGKKAALKPIHDKLISLGRALGKDVKVCPCQTIVPLYREHVFAEVKPATNSRIDFGLALARFVKAKKGKIPARLIDTGGLEKKNRITHRIPIESLNQVDDDVKKWAKIAYDLDAPE